MRVASWAPGCHLCECLHVHMGVSMALCAPCGFVDECLLYLWKTTCPGMILSFLLNHERFIT